MRVGVREPPKADTYIRASSLSELCAREEVLAGLLQVSRPHAVDSDTNLAFALGSGMHHIFQSTIAEHLGPIFVGQWRCSNCHFTVGGLNTPEGNVSRPAACPLCSVDDESCPEEGPLFRFVEQAFLSEEYNFGGHNDGFLRFPGFAELGDGIFELKSISDFRAQDIKDVPDLGHAVQVQAYLWLTGLKWALLLYWNKGAFRNSLTEYFLERDEDTIEQIKSLLWSIRRGIRGEGPLPPRICSSPDCNRAEGCLLVKPCFDPAARSIDSPDDGTFQELAE